MPDLALSIASLIVGALFGAGGLTAYLKMRSDARLAVASQQDEHSLKLRDALDRDEADFRKAVYDAFQDGVARTREMDGRLRETQAQLNETQMQLIRSTAQRDDLQRQLDQANVRIRHLEAEIATLQEQQKVHP